LLQSRPRGVAARGRVWAGTGTSPYDDGIVLVDDDGRVARVGPAGEIELPDDVPVLGGPGAWIGPGIVDAHVHLAFGAPHELAAGGVTAVRDLGAPPQRAADWRTGDAPPAGSPRIAVAGPLLTAPGGYPSQSWGAAGFAAFVADPDAAIKAVRALAASVDVIKVAIEPTGGPTPDEQTVRAIVDAAHEAGLAVTAHALTVDAVRVALAGGVDELAHTPVERLPAGLIDAIAAARIGVVSTLQTFADAGTGGGAMVNAAALYATGAVIRYGTDLGNAGTRPGVDPRELERLAETGMGRAGALAAATTGAANAPGLQGTGATGRLVAGGPADLVVLAGDPLEQPDHWSAPVAVLVAGREASATRPPTLDR
jgi:imidazolonepropionase-like amidohydrolase